MVNKTPVLLLAAFPENFVHVRYFTGKGFIIRSIDQRPDIDIIAEDSELTASARSISSTAHSRGVLEDRKLLVPTWIIISSGFLRSSGLK